MITKFKLNIMLYSLLGSIDLVSKWWDSPNKGFDGRKPNESTLEEVYTYLIQFMAR